jgi:hypothetical protein
MNKTSRDSGVIGDNRGIIAHALASSTDKAAPKKAQDLRIGLTKKEEAQLTWLCTLLGGSVSYVSNAAIRYALYVSKREKTSIEKLKGFPKREGSAASFEITLTLDTLARIKEDEIPDTRLVKCAILGLSLLCERLK